MSLHRVRENIIFRLNWIWLYKMADYLFPLYGVGDRKSPRLHECSQAEAEAIRKILEQRS